MLIQQTRSTEGSLFNRSLSRLKELWKSFPLVAEDGSLQQANIDLQGDSLDVLRQEIQYCLNQAVGEMATRKQAVLIAHQYLELSALGKERFLNLLAEDFDLDYAAVKTTINNWQPNPVSTTELRQALESPRLTLLRQFNELPDGIKFLVNMRADLLNIKDKNEALQGLQQEMKQLLHAWFDLGFLQLQKITWDSPTSLLEKLIEYEAVHAINGWSDLKNRLANDRCCYAFFHPQMPDEPLIFIEVALTKGLAGKMDPLLDEEAPVLDTDLADTAIFYSISNTQRGLAGISFGNFLIKNVVAQLLQQYPHLKQFSTLSPIPGFNKWLRHNQDQAMAQLTDEQTKQLNDYCEELGLAANISDLLAFSWQDNQALSDWLEAPIKQLISHYLTMEKRGLNALDPVANFHLSNGAKAARLNWRANLSERGLNESAAVMINYIYELDKIESNCVNYVETGQIANDLIS